MTTQTAQPEHSSGQPPARPRAGQAEALTPNRAQLWVAAIKPPMYCVAVMPICAGSAAAYAQTGRFHLGSFVTFVCSAVLILVWENLSNDVFDAATGIDENKPHSLVNLTQNRRLIFWIGNACLLLGMAGILALALWQQDVTVLGMVMACCGLGYLYQGPPFRLGYLGLGEFLCFFSFGPLAVGAAYYVQVPQALSWRWDEPLLAAVVVVGAATTLVLFCSHFHQVEDDLKAGKKSPIARLGTQRSAQLLPWACGSVLAVTLLAIARGGLPLSCLALVASAPAAVRLCRHVLAFHDRPAQVSNAKFLAIHFHAWSGLLLVAGLVAPRLWGT